MGSSYFYLEFLVNWIVILKKAGYSNPAIYALDYSLVPDAVFPTQLNQTISGYEFVLSMAGDPSRICVSGDSAGGTLILSLLLHRSQTDRGNLEKPALAALISPWVTLVSPRNTNSKRDFLDMDRLHHYAQKYCGTQGSVDDPVVSPGACEDLSWWKRASPKAGFVCFYGSEEIFSREIRRWRGILEKAGCEYREWEEPYAVHVWPVVDLFTDPSSTGRVRGLVELSRLIRERMAVVEDN